PTPPRPLLSTPFPYTTLFRSLFDFVAEVDETLGVISEKCAGIGQAHRASATNEERLAEGVLELADSQTDGRLRAVKTLGSARERSEEPRLNSSHVKISYAVFC